MEHPDTVELLVTLTFKNFCATFLKIFNQFGWNLVFCWDLLVWWTPYSFFVLVRSILKQENPTNVISFKKTGIGVFSFCWNSGFLTVPWVILKIGLNLRRKCLCVYVHYYREFADAMRSSCNHIRHLIPIQILSGLAGIPFKNGLVSCVAWRLVARLWQVKQAWEVS